MVSALAADGGEEDVPIGFNFEFEGVTYDTVSATSDGFLSFVKGGTSTAGNDLDNGSAARRPLVAPLWDDHDGRASSSQAAYEVTGTAPNRVFTFEWRDWEWSWNATDSVVSFQAKLYETSNVVEFTYRWECDSCITGPDASIGLSGASSFLSVTGLGSGAPSVSNQTEDASIDTVVTDQVFTFTLPACPAPNLDSVVNITSSSVDLYWSNTGSDTVLINWGPAGFNQGTSTAAQFDTSDNGFNQITGLAAGTFYDVYLRRDCNGSFSPWLGPIVVRTQCVAQSLPYQEDFSANLGCFSVIDSGSTNDTWNQVQDYSNFSGTQTLDGNPGFAFADSDGAGSGVDMNEYLVSPVIDASGLAGSLILEFDQYYNALGDNADVEVYDRTNWVTVLAQTADIGDWGAPDQQSIDVTQYANANFQVRFHYYNANWAWYWAIDNFSVAEVLCNSSTNLAATTIATDSVSFNWQPGSGSNFGIEYGTSGFTPGTGTLASTVDTFFTANNLLPNTAYDFYVIDSCTSNNSTPAGPLTVRTLCLPATAPYTQTFDGSDWISGTGFGNTGDTIGSCWSRNPAPGDYAWNVRNTSTGSGSTGPDTDNSGTGNFIYTEASNGSSGDTALFTSPLVDVSSLTTPFLSFYYHRYGSDIPDFEVQVNDGNGWVTLASFTGPEQTGSSDAFVERGINISAYGPLLQVRFLAISEGCCSGDMAIDDVSIIEAPSCADPLNLAATNVIDTAATLQWTTNATSSQSTQVWFGPQGFYQGTQTTGGVQVLATADSLRVDTLRDLTCYEFLVRTICAPGDTSAWVGPQSFCTPPSCPAPSAIGSFDEQLTTAEVYWTTGGANNFNVEYGVKGFSQGNGTLVNSANDTLSLSGLSPSTTYDVYVRDSCGPGDVSVWVGPYSFNTAYTTNFLEEFDNNAFTNSGWFEADGQLTSNTVFTSTFSSWGFDDFGNNTANTSAAGVNMWLGNQYEWLISLSIFLDPAITNLQVEFDAAITDFANTNQGFFGSDDSLAIVISTDNGQTWDIANILWSRTSGDTIDASGEHFVVSLAGYSGYVRFGIYAGSTIDDPEDNDWYVDNFEVRTPRACTNPSNLAASNITTSSAVARWTPGDTAALGWEVLLTSGGQPASAGQSLTPTAIDSLALTGLNASTTYCFYVIEQCANGFSDTIGPECFTTQCVPFTAPYTQNFDAAPAVDPFAGIACWNVIGPGANDIELNDSPDPGVDPAPSAPNSVELNDGNFSTGDTAILVSPTFSDLNSGLNRIEFEAAFENTVEQLFIGLLDDPNDASTLRIIDTITTSTVDVYQTYTYDFDDPALVGAAQNIAFVHGTDIYEVYIDNFKYEAIGAPSCTQPTALASTGANCDTLSLNWTSNSGGSIIQYGPTGFTPGQGTFTGVVTAPYDLTGLALNTDYDIWVADTCTGDTSAFAGPITVSTDSVGPLLGSFTSTESSVTATSALINFDATASTNAVSYSWDFDNGNTGTGANPSETFNSNGTYNVELTVTDRCVATDYTTIAVVVEGISIEENAWNGQVALYPNPSNGVVNIDLPQAGDLFTVRITDLAGKTIFRKEDLQPNHSHTLNLPNVAQGIYLVKVKSEGKEEVYRLRVK